MGAMARPLSRTIAPSLQWLASGSSEYWQERDRADLEARALEVGDKLPDHRPERPDEGRLLRAIAIAWCPAHRWVLSLTRDEWPPHACGSSG